MPISGIQHFAFCRRQWALIHVEGQWKDNHLTIGGDFFHERVHDETKSGNKDGVKEARSLWVVSRGVWIETPGKGSLQR